MKKILEEDKRFEVVGIATNDEEEIYPKRIMIIGDNKVKYYMIILSYGRTLISKI